LGRDEALSRGELKRMTNPFAPRLALLFAERGLVQEMRLSLAAKALLPLAEGSAEEAPLLLAEEGLD
jgi:hypothetical protein